MDDNQAILHGLSRALSRHHDICIATTPDEALRRLEESPCHLVISDYDLSAEHDGVWLLEQVALRHPRTRIMLTSGDEGAQLAARTLELEAFWYKPLDPATLIDWLAER